MIAVLVAASLVASACSGSGSSDEADRAADREVTDQREPDAELATIAFTSSDGSATPDTSTVFTVTSTENDSQYLVSVAGAGEDTRSEVQLEPGTYRIASDDVQVSATGSSKVRDLSPTEVTIEAGASDPTEVEFGLDVQRTPLDLRLEEVSDTTVALAWEAIDGVDVAQYVLRRTEGSAAAADPSDGAAVELKEAAATTALAEGLSPATEQTFTLFATSSDGEALASRSLTTTTASADGVTPAFALAPNTIVPDDLAALAPEPLGTGMVSISLDPENGGRSSGTEIPGVDDTILADGCAVGLPVMVSSEVAGDLAFYGLIEDCRERPRSFAAQASGTQAVVNTDVPLAAVVPFLHFENAQVNPCFDAEAVPQPADSALCRAADTDGDGVQDTAEEALGLDPATDNGGWDAWKVPEPVPPADGDEAGETPVGELEAPEGLGTGQVQVTLLWTTGDDLDLSVTDPSNTLIFHTAKTSPSGGRLDVDNRGDPTCQSTETRAENIYWASDAPKGAYTVDIDNYPVNGGTCNTQPRARLEVRVDGQLVVDRTAVVNGEGSTTFRVTDPPFTTPALSVPGSSTTGDLDVNLVWNTGDDMNIDVTDPINASIPRDAADPSSCAATSNSIEHAGIPTGAAPGTYFVEVSLARSCKQGRADGWLFIHVRGEMVLRQAVVLEGGKSAFFSVAVPGPRVADLRQPARAPDRATTTRAPKPAAAPDRGTATRAPKPAATPAAPAAPKITCDSTADVLFDPGFGFGEFHKTSVTLKWGTLAWDITAGVTAYVDPKMDLEGGVECALDVTGATFQLTSTPVPINLELAPVLEGSATGTFELTGPRLALSFGARSTGRVDARLEYCGWWKFKAPCGADVDAKASASPIGGFEHGDATMKVEGELALGLGVEATLGVGIKNAFVTAKSGFAFKMKPIVGKLTASGAVSVGARPSGGSAARRDNPPYGPGVIDAVYYRQAGTSRLVSKSSCFSETPDCISVRTSPDQRGVLPVVGPTTATGCMDTTEKIRGTRTVTDPQTLGVRRVRMCADAECLPGAPPVVDALTGATVAAITGPMLTAFQSCGTARCYVGGEVVDAGTLMDGTAECRQEPKGAATPSGSGGTTVGADLKLCASASIEAEMAVDFRAEAWVMGWGKDQRYPIWEGGFAYPGAKFELGDCDD